MERRAPSIWTASIPNAPGGCQAMRPSSRGQPTPGFRHITGRRARSPPPVGGQPGGPIGRRAPDSCQALASAGEAANRQACHLHSPGTDSPSLSRNALTFRPFPEMHATSPRWRAAQPCQSVPAETARPVGAAQPRVPHMGARWVRSIASVPGIGLRYCRRLPLSCPPCLLVPAQAGS